jgi:hypothetical protein
MSKEPIIQDKIHLLMEETGCEQGQAELAMASAGYDLEKAIRTIGVLLRHIVVVKGKFMLPSKNLYGLLILIADTKRQTLFRIRCVVSYNPALYETPLGGDWFDFEKALYAFRLWEGTLQQVTQTLERGFSEQLEKEVGAPCYDMLRQGDENRLRDCFRRIISDHFSGADMDIDLVHQELNLEQFRRFKSHEQDALPNSNGSRTHELGTGENLVLHVDLQQDPDGLPARKISTGDSVCVLLTDDRDIAQYLSKLMGGRSENGLKPLTAPVEGIRRENGTVHFQIRLSVGILGLAEAHHDSLLRVHKRSTPRWWQKWALFGD